MLVAILNLIKSTDDFLRVEKYAIHQIVDELKIKYQQTYRNLF
jgi:hypothetical protein